MDGKLNILMVTMQMDIGGAETHVLELSRALTQMGHRVTVASAGGAFVSQLEKSGIKHIALPLNTKRPVAVLRSYHGLKKLIKSENYDIVHAHARIPAFICGILQKKLGFHFTTTVHWVFDVNFLWRKLANWGDCQMAVSQDIKQYLIDNYGCAPDNIFVTINGIDTEKFSPLQKHDDIEKEFSLSNGKHRTVIVSRTDKSRGRAVRALCDIAESLYKRYDDTEIVIVGDAVLENETNELDYAKKKAKELKNKYGRDIIITTGMRTDTAKFMAAADVFVGVSRAALEAMSCGVPVVLAGNEGYAGVFGSACESVAYKTNFCLRGCDLLDDKKLFDDICALYDADEKTRRGIGEYGREVIIRDFSALKMAHDYLEMYSAMPRAKINEYADIIMSGYYGFGNTGDDSIARAIAENLRAEDANAKISVLCAHPNKNRQKYGMRAINRFNVFRISREMKHAKLLIFGGGNLLQNTTSARSLFYYLAIIKMAKHRGLKVMMYANGIGPVFGDSAAAQAKEAVELCDAVSLREPSSLDTLTRLGVRRNDIVITADPALCLCGADESRIEYLCDRIKVVKGRKYFAVSLREWHSLKSAEGALHNEGEFRREIASAINKIKNETGAYPIFIVMQSSHDRDICERVAEECGDGVVIASGLSANELIGLFRRCELVIAMRLHALIYAAAADTPLVGISYDPKIESMLEYMEYEKPLDAADFKSDELFARALRAMKNPSPRRVSEKLLPLAKSDALRALSMIK